MSDTPMKVVIDCSATGAPDPAIVAQIEAEALELLRTGEVEKAVQVMDAVRTAAALPDAVSIMPLSEEELKQRAVDDAAAALVASQPPPLSPAEKIVAALAASKVLSPETQQALRDAVAPPDLVDAAP